MNLIVFGATGQVGKRVVSTALAHGHKVKAFGRNVHTLIDADIRNDKLEAIKGSVFDEEAVYNAITGCDGVLSALGGGFDGVDKTRSLGIKTIIAQMKKAAVNKIVAVGNSAVLSTSNNEYILDQPDFPAEYIPVGQEHLQAYQYLVESNLSFTFLCPPAIHDADASENYTTSETYLPQPNLQYINAGDIAHFMLKEIEHQQYPRKRVGMSAR